MKILIVSTTFSKDEGGATGIAYQQALVLKRLGYEVFVFAGTRENSYGWQDEEGIKIYKIKNKNYRYIIRSYLCLFNFRVQKEFKKVLNEINPEIIHFHNLYFQLPFSLIKIAKQNDRKVFFTTHDVMTFSQQKLTFFVDKKWNLQNIDQIDYKLPLGVQIRQDKKAFNPFRNILIRYYLRFCNKIFAVSFELKKALNQNGIKNVEVIHNGIDVNNWVSEIEVVNKIKNNFGLNNKQVVLFAGRLSGDKGGRVIIDAMSVVVKDNPQAILLILGEKNESVEKLQKDILGNNLSKNVVFTGLIPRGEIKNYYAVADVVVVPSICFDSFPTVNLEAMACKKPVITTCFGGGKEAVVNGETGLVVNPLNIEFLSDKINSLLNDDNVRKKIGKSGQEKVKENFSELTWINKIISFYK